MGPDVKVLISIAGTFLLIYFIAMFACGIPVFFQVSLPYLPRLDDSKP